MKTGTSVGRRLKLLRSIFFGGAAVAIAFLPGIEAHAVSAGVKNACRNDYFEHCSQYAVDTEELRQCMRKVGENLSTPCLVALVQDGQITKEDVERHNAAKGTSVKKKSEVESEDPGDAKAAATKTTKKKAAAKKHGKKDTDVAEASDTAPKPNAPPESALKLKSGGETKKSAKASKTHKTRTKKKVADASPTGKLSVRKKGKINGAASAANTAAKPAGTTSPVGKKSKHKKPATASSARKLKTEAETKKTAAGTGVKAKKTSKKKTTATRNAKPVDATAP
jgi:hypothetical protein